MKKVFILDETGGFGHDTLSRSHVYCAVFVNIAPEKLNKNVLDFASNNGVSVKELHAYDLNKSETGRRIIDSFCRCFQDSLNVFIKTFFVEKINYSDDHNYQISLDSILNYLLLFYVDDGDDVSIFVEQRPHHRSQEELESLEYEKYKSATIQEAEKIKNIYESYKSCKTEVYFSSQNAKGHELICIPDIIGFKFSQIPSDKKDEVPVNPSFFQNCLNQNFEYALAYYIFTASKILTSDRINLASRYLKKIYDIFRSNNIYVSIELFSKFLIDLVTPLATYDNLKNSKKVLNNVIVLLQERRDLFGDTDTLKKYFENFRDKKKTLNNNGNQNIIVCFNDVFDKIKFDINECLITTVRKDFLNINVTNDSIDKLEKYKNLLELIRNEVGIAQEKDLYLAKVFGTLGQAYALCDKYEKARQCFEKNKEFLPSSISDNKIENYIFTLEWYFNKLNDSMFQSYLNKNRIKDPFWVLNILRYFSSKIREKDRNNFVNQRYEEIVKQAENISDKIKDDDDTADLVLKFLLKKWLCIDYLYLKKENRFDKLFAEISGIEGDLLVFKAIRYHTEIIKNRISFINILPDMPEELLNILPKFKKLYSQNYLLQYYDVNSIYRLLPFYYS